MRLYGKTAQAIAAYTLLIFGMVLTVLSFYTVPIGIIHQSVQYIFAQCLIYSGSILGITNYIKYLINEKNK